MYVFSNDDDAVVITVEGWAKVVITIFRAFGPVGIGCVNDK